MNPEQFISEKGLGEQYAEWKEKVEQEEKIRDEEERRKRKELDKQRRKEFGQQLKTARQELGLSQGALAGKIGITPSSISQYESGGADTSIPTLIRLCKILGVSADKLLGLE